MEKEFSKILAFLHLAEKLKIELRHSWLSNNTQESVAEHTWRTALMAILLEPHLENPVNLEKVLKMVIIHDIVEAQAGDIPAFEKNRKEEKIKNEQKAIENIKKMLGNKTGDEIHDLWSEFENSQTIESKFVKALDRIEVLIQHNEADIKTWNEIEHSYNLMSSDKYCEFDKAIKMFNEMVKKDSMGKLKASGIDIEKAKFNAAKMRNEK
ncbi:MAG: HD domain-containing protein [Candidatus Aenigmarchaeota archaeon]|nr:HD domain-containing protein [Candidatus Aenigmarchaeota archaeon]